ncbi:hypothetical protein WN944_023203 [Citrus x changshan-huyou]|uniref:Uncharacterized protein n=1 Tax=Citrus x changshan-huyou TaxID=2935761 RepID=A0AAP0R3N8_9ROSI
MERVKIPIWITRGSNGHPDEGWDPKAIPKIKGISFVNVFISQSSSPSSSQSSSHSSPAATSNLISLIPSDYHLNLHLLHPQRPSSSIHHQLNHLNSSSIIIKNPAPPSSNSVSSLSKEQALLLVANPFSPAIIFFTGPSPP